MIVSMNVSHLVKVCHVLTILHQLVCRGVANFGTRCSICPVAVPLLCFTRNAMFSALNQRPRGRGFESRWLRAVA